MGSAEWSGRLWGWKQGEVLCNLGSERTSSGEEVSAESWRNNKGQLLGTWCWGRGQLQPRPRHVWLRNARGCETEPRQILGGPLADFDVAETLAHTPRYAFTVAREEDEPSVQASESGGWAKSERTAWKCQVMKEASFFLFPFASWKYYSCCCHHNPQCRLILTEMAWPAFILPSALSWCEITFPIIQMISSGNLSIHCKRCFSSPDALWIWTKAREGIQIVSLCYHMFAAGLGEVSFLLILLLKITGILENVKVVLFPLRSAVSVASLSFWGPTVSSVLSVLGWFSGIQAPTLPS